MKKVKLPSNPMGWAILLIGCGIAANVATAPAVRKYNQVKNQLGKKAAVA